MKEKETFHQHDILTRNFERLKASHTRTERKKNIINTSQISTDTHCSDSKSCLVTGQLADHASQLRLQLENLTVQATNRGEHSVPLVPVIQEQVVAPQIPHIGLQMLDAGLKVRLLMLKPHPLKQRFLILLQILTAPKPPVTNYWKSVTFKTQKLHEKATNLPKKIKTYNTKILPQTSDRQESYQQTKIA